MDGQSLGLPERAETAGGDLLLFLDADVRISPDGIAGLAAEYETCGCTVSVLPYHRMKRTFEQLSMFFNLIQIAANGIGLPLKAENAGLFGPVILMEKEEYFAIGGHSSVRKSIVDDLAIGRRLTEKNRHYSLFLGGECISYRMYGDMKSLCRGWIKKFATGAVQTQLLIFLMVFFWVSSCLSVPLNIIKSITANDFLYITLTAILYLVWVAELIRISRRAGNFSMATAFLYPVTLLFFIGVFFVSLFKKLFGFKVIWKDRKIELRD